MDWWRRPRFDGHLWWWLVVLIPLFLPPVLPSLPILVPLFLPIRSIPRLVRTTHRPTLLSIHLLPASQLPLIAHVDNPTIRHTINPKKQWPWHQKKSFEKRNQNHFARECTIDSYDCTSLPSTYRGRSCAPFSAAPSNLQLLGFIWSSMYLGAHHSPSDGQSQPLATACMRQASAHWKMAILLDWYTGLSPFLFKSASDLFLL